MRCSHTVNHPYIQSRTKQYIAGFSTYECCNTPAYTYTHTYANSFHVERAKKTSQRLTYAGAYLEYRSTKPLVHCVHSIQCDFRTNVRARFFIRHSDRNIIILCSFIAVQTNCNVYSGVCIDRVRKIGSLCCICNELCCTNEMETRVIFLETF